MRPTGVVGTGWPVRASNADEPLLHIPTAFQKAEADPRIRGTVSYPDLVGLEVFLDGRNRSPPAPGPKSIVIRRATRRYVV